MLSARENLLRAIFFQKPEWIPVVYSINPSYYFAMDAEEVLDFQSRHPALFPGFVRPEKGTFLHTLRDNLGGVKRAYQKYVDDFGCTWETTMEGMTGTVTRHPLSDLEKVKTHPFPNPEICMGIGPINWDTARRL